MIKLVIGLAFLVAFTFAGSTVIQPSMISSSCSNGVRVKCDSHIKQGWCRWDCKEFHFLQDLANFSGLSSKSKLWSIKAMDPAGDGYDGCHYQCYSGCSICPKDNPVIQPSMISSSCSNGVKVKCDTHIKQGYCRWDCKEFHFLQDLANFSGLSSNSLWSIKAMDPAGDGWDGCHYQCYSECSICPTRRLLELED